MREGAVAAIDAAVRGEVSVSVVSAREIGRLASKGPLALDLELLA